MSDQKPNPLDLARMLAEKAKDVTVEAVQDPAGTAKRAAEQAKGVAELGKLVAEDAADKAKAVAEDVVGRVTGRG